MTKATYHYEADQVRNHARGAWLEIFSRLAPDLSEAIDRAPRHVDCPLPGHGGAKDFRLYRDAAQTGGAVCTCGASHDGFELLMKLYGWNFTETLKEVGDLIGAPKIEHRRSTQAKAKPAQAEQQVIDQEDLGEPVRTIKGELIDFGTAPYRFNDKNTDSFYAQIELANGAEQTHWAVDLDRALKAAGAQVGHKVVLKHYGKKPATIIIQPTRPGQQPVEKQVEKNIWACENLTALAAQENTSADIVDDCDSGEQHSVSAETAKPQANQNWLEEAKKREGKREQKRKKADARIAQAHAEAWNRCISIDSDMASPVHRYLHGRAITITMAKKNHLSSEHIRFSVNEPYYEENEEKKYEKVGEYPAIVCAVRSPEGEIMTLHRTFLTHKGQKAPVENARKMMPVPQAVRLGGSAIRLGEPLNGYLGVAEGMETALAATQGFGVPCWSTVSATLLAQFEPPKDVHTVVIFADKDRSATGEIAAEQLKARLESEGIKVLVMLPQQAIPAMEKGIDWNDVLQVHGLLGFPSRRAFDRLIQAA